MQSRTTIPTFVMLVGLPGSGKSTFARQLVQSHTRWECISQDELGSRQGVEDALGHLAKNENKSIVVDRCNVRRQERKALLKIAFDPEDAVCVHFDMRADDCLARVGKRTDHPTIPFGGGRAAVQGMQAVFEIPNCKEGFKDIILLHNFREVEELLGRWGAKPPDIGPVGFFKFPSTPHVVNLTGIAPSCHGGEKLLKREKAVSYFDGITVVIVEEKMSGENLGISLSSDWEPLFQNRLQYITSDSGSQWSGLNEWWESNGWAIYQILKPEEEVLFGSWAPDGHAKLHCNFVAFDIYNKCTNHFCSTMDREHRLDGSGIPIVPVLLAKPFDSVDELVHLLNHPSILIDEPLNGIYLRINESPGCGRGLNLSQRGQIVRSTTLCP